jgi:predicted dithiol-disulfide oxidoreductase (DUF899 family)
VKFPEESLQNHEVVSREAWLVARRKLLSREKELTRLRDAISAERRRLPWVRVEKRYFFDTTQGRQALADLFAGRSQLLIHHFMMGPASDQGCVGCSFQADHVDGALVHLAHRDVSFVRVSRAPLAEIQGFNARMGWRAKWVSAHDSDFNYDFNVSFRKEDIERGTACYNYKVGEVPVEDLPGVSVFFRNDAGEVFHTYSTFARGGEQALTTYFYLDLLPKGREESTGRGNLSDWVRHHDRYEVNPPGQCGSASGARR